MADTMRCTRPPHNQAQSRLMRLPAEIRSKVLRFTLKRGDVLISLREYFQRHNGAWIWSEKSWDRGVQLSSQVLATCQTLYSEAYGVLYDENHLGIFCHSKYGNESSILDELEVHVLDSSCEHEFSPGSLIDIEDALVEHTVFYSDRIETLGKHLGHSARRLDTIQRFSRIQVNFRVGDNDLTATQIRVFCTVWMTILHNTHLRFQLSGPLPRKSVQNSTSILKECRILRCKSFEFPDFNGKECLSVERVICQSVASNTFAMWRHFLREVVNPLPRNGQEEFQVRYKDQLDELQVYAESYHDQGFRRLRSSLLKQMKDWTVQCFTARAERAGCSVEELRDL